MTLKGATFTSFARSDISLSFLLDGPRRRAHPRVLGAHRLRHRHRLRDQRAGRVFEELKEVRPTLFGSVPRIFEKATRASRARSPRPRCSGSASSEWPSPAGLAVVEAWQGGRAPTLPQRLAYRVADRLVFARVREAFGGRIKLFLTGAAPIPRPILAFFWAAGLPTTRCTA